MFFEFGLVKSRFFVRFVLFIVFSLVYFTLTFRWFVVCLRLRSRVGVRRFIGLGFGI